MRDRLMVSSTIMKNMSAAKVDGMMEAFDKAEVGAVFFNRHGRVTAINGQARRIMGSHLSVVQNELRGSRGEESAEIKRQMKAVLGPSWLIPKDNPPILIQRIGQRPLLVRVQRLGGSLQDVFTHSVGVCLIEDLDPRKDADPSVLLQLGLTKAEIALALNLTAGLTMQEAAAARSISYETARTHLRSIFEKTGIRRQAELISLVSRLAGNFHGD